MQNAKHAFSPYCNCEEEYCGMSISVLWHGHKRIVALTKVYCGTLGVSVLLHGISLLLHGHKRILA